MTTLPLGIAMVGPGFVYGVLRPTDLYGLDVDDGTLRLRPSDPHFSPCLARLPLALDGVWRCSVTRRSEPARHTASHQVIRTTKGVCRAAPMEGGMLPTALRLEGSQVALNSLQG